MMETFAERFLKLRQSTGLSVKNMAMLLGISENSVTCYEEGYSQPDINVLTRLAQIFNVSEAYVAMITDDPKCAEDYWAKEIYVAKQLRPGDGMITANNIATTVYINRDETHGKDFYGLLVKDDSMSKARMFRGDTLIIQRQSHASNGDVVVAMVDDESEIVRRYQRKGNIVILTPESDQAEYKTLKIDTTETKLLVLGVVREVRITNV